MMRRIVVCGLAVFFLTCGGVPGQEAKKEEKAPGTAPAATGPGPATGPAAGPPATGPAANGPAAPPIGEYRQPETYLEFAIAGGPLMIPIGLASVAWLAFLVERIIATRRSRVLPSPLVKTLKSRSPDDPHLKEIIASHPSAASRILLAALERLSGPREDLERAVNGVAQREIHELRRHVRIFAIIASVAPLLGLLGTVQGMIQAFRVVTLVGLGAGRNLAPGIYLALITTAGGLLVAIPSLLTYYWFMSRADRYVHELDGLVMEFVDSRERGRSPP